MQKNKFHRMHVVPAKAKLDRQMEEQTDGGLIESTTTLYKDREIHPSVKDLQSTTRLAKSWKLHIFDTKVDFPVPVKSGG